MRWSWFERLALGAIGLCAVAVVCFIGYGIWFAANDPGHGTVTDKQYQPAYTTTQCTTVNKVTTCMPEYHGECYEVDYNDGHHDGYRCLSQGEYNSYKVGDYYPRGAS